MNAWLIAGPAGVCWLTASRVLFRHWWRYDTLQGRRRCPNTQHWSYYRNMEYTHSGKCCLGTQDEPYAMPVVVGLAMLAGLFWPLMLAAGLVIWRAPRSTLETQARIAELERELNIGQSHRIRTGRRDD